MIARLIKKFFTEIERRYPYTDWGFVDVLVIYGAFVFIVSVYAISENYSSGDFLLFPFFYMIALIFLFPAYLVVVSFYAMFVHLSDWLRSTFDLKFNFVLLDKILTFVVVAFMALHLHASYMIPKPKPLVLSKPKPTINITYLRNVLKISDIAKRLPKLEKTELSVPSVEKSQIIFVTPQGLPSNKGDSWQNSTSLQNAINIASSARNFIFVAQGVYSKNKETDLPNYFVLKNGVKIYGGFDANSKELKRFKNTSFLRINSHENANSGNLIRGENLSAIQVLDAFVIQNSANKSDKQALIFLKNSNLILENMSLLNNSNEKMDAFGSVIHSENSNLKIIGSRFYYNHSYTCPALYAKNSDIEIVKSDFHKNASFYTGALCTINSKLVLKDTQFLKNKSILFAGAIFAFASNLQLDSSKFLSNNSHYGGAVFDIKSDISAKNSEFNKNRAVDSGGAFVNLFSKLDFRSTNFNSNSTESFAGAIYNFVSSIKVANSTFKANKAEHFGGALYNFMGDSEFKYTNFDSNMVFTKRESFGGGVFNLYHKNSLFQNVVFKGNSADGGGGALVNLYKSSPTILNSLFQRNDSHLDAGAIRNSFLSSPKLINSNFISNYSDQIGVLSNLIHSSPTIKFCKFEKNLSRAIGVMLNRSNSHPKIFNSIFHSNSASMKYGVTGVMLNLQSNPIIVNSSFSKNSANSVGVIENRNSTTKILNSVFVENISNKNAPINNYLSSKVVVLNSILWNNKKSTEVLNISNYKDSVIKNSIFNMDSLRKVNNLIVEMEFNNSIKNPMFLDFNPEAGFYELDANSPAKDAGDLSLYEEIMESLGENLNLDLNRSKRIKNDQIDIGALELN